MRQPINRVRQTIHSLLYAKMLGVRGLWWVVGVGAALLFCLIVLLTFYSGRSVIDRSIAADVDFSVYAPSRPPEGYSVHHEQTRAGDDVVIYGFIDEETQKNITVTVQERAAGFNIAQMSKGGSINSTTTANGTLYDLSVGQSSQYLLDTGDALIYLTSPGRIDTPTVTALASSLKKIN